MQSVAFKEWALVCAALGEGVQSILLRKGGIAEGRRGFAFEHREFFLLPTYFHEQIAKVRTTGGVLPAVEARMIEIALYARVESLDLVTSPDVIRALEPFHVLRDDVVRERFDYGATRSLHVAFVRIFRLDEPWHLPDSRALGGCRSWVNLPGSLPDLQLTPVLAHAEHQRRFEAFRAAVGGTVSAPMTG